MTATSAANYPTLGFDPTPGDHTQAADVARTVRSGVDVLAEISSVLHGAADGEWRGQAAIAFRDLLDDDLRPKVDEAHRSFDKAAGVLRDWADQMSRDQTEARRLERLAAEAAERLSAAHSAVAGLPPAPTGNTPPPVDDAEERQRERDAGARATANRQVSDAEGDLDNLRGQARRLKEAYAEAGRIAATQLQQAIDIAPNEPGMFSKLVDGIGNALSELGEALADFGDFVLEKLEQLAPLLKIIGDIAGVLSAVCGLLAFIPGLQFLAIPALILGGVALAAHYLEAAGKTGSFLKAFTDPDVLLDAVGLALGIGALKVGGQLVSVARASGNTRMVPQLIGPAQEMAPGFFSLARSGSYSMELPEFAWRTVNLKLTQGSLFATGAGARGNFDTIGQLATWNWGPMTQKASVR